MSAHQAAELRLMRLPVRHPPTSVVRVDISLDATSV